MFLQIHLVPLEGAIKEVTGSYRKDMKLSLVFLNSHPFEGEKSSKFIRHRENFNF